MDRRGFGTGAALALIALWSVGRRFLPAVQRIEDTLASHLGELDSSEVFALAVISGFSEELFFRGALQSSWGWGWATVIFTLMHSGPGRAFRLWTMFALLAALVFGGMTFYRGNILAAVIAHFLVNAVNLRYLLRHRRPQVPVEEKHSEPQE